MKQPVLFPNLVARLKAAGLPLENLEQVIGRRVLLAWNPDSRDTEWRDGFLEKPLAAVCRIQEIQTFEFEGFCQIALHFEKGSDPSLPESAYCDVWDRDPAETPWKDIHYTWEIWPGCKDLSCGWHTGGDTVCAKRHYSEDYISAKVSLLPEKSF